MAPVIVATAGHVDHGKTALVRALTGVDADRLPEEKRRAMTIDLGFAYRGALGFVDVPGHERFIHNMLAGVPGIDLALLVVAADDGPMPQTHEHLQILRLLGVPRIAVALTKIDRVSRERKAEVLQDVAGLLPRAELFPVSSITGEGIGALEAFLESLQAQKKEPKGNFRLSVDRAFTLPGAGLVVTGTAMSGEIAAGAEVRALLAGTSARVRAIHAHDAPASRGRAGERLALNLAGFDGRAPIARGDWIVAGAAPPAVRRFDARLELATRPGARGLPVHLHIGAANVLARIFPLDPPWFHLVAERPVGASFGDRFVVRDSGARRTLGGGTVIDIHPPLRGRARPERLAWLAAMAIEDDDAALAALAEDALSGVDLARFAANRNLPARRGWHFSARRWHAVRERALAELADFHASRPELACLAEDRVLSRTGLAAAARRLVVEALEKEGRVVREPAGVRLASHRLQLPAADALLWKRVRPLLERGGLRPPTVAEMAQAAGVDRSALEKALQRLAAHGEVVRVSPNRYFLPAPLRRLEGMILDMQTVSAGAFRDRTGLGRGLAIELLEYFDRTHLTRRAGGVHVVRVRHVA